jgi:hypothetical protein
VLRWAAINGGGSVGASVRRGFGGKGTGPRQRVVRATHQCAPRGGEEARRGREASGRAGGGRRPGEEGAAGGWGRS